MFSWDEGPAMKDYLRALSGRAEFLIVVVGAFGLFVLSNLVVLLNPELVANAPPIDNAQLNSLVAHEIVVLLVLGAFLRARGWTAEKLGICADLRDTVIGVGLMALALAATKIMEALAGHFAPERLEAALRFEQIAGPLSFPTVAAVCIVNPIFEELFVCAYVIAALREKRGAAFAMNVSVGLRVTYHLYQGIVGVLLIAPVGLLFAYWYVRSGRLWPLIVAHGLLDFIALMQTPS
jgi:membrane protease YdiL (CAAX protease family)